jgi:hypothetical protein
VTVPESDAVVVAIWELLLGVMLAIATSKIAIPLQYHRDFDIRFIFNVKPPVAIFPERPNSTGRLHEPFESISTGNQIAETILGISIEKLLRSLRCDYTGPYGKCESLIR